MGKARKTGRKKGREKTGTGTFRGHPTIQYYVKATGEEEERYASDGVLTPAWGNPEGIERPCVRCGMIAGPPEPNSMHAYGPDPCLGILHGVIGACCGHGVEEPYLAFDTITGKQALRLFESLKIGPSKLPSSNPEP
jgi:hypothetical protein